MHETLPVPHPDDDPFLAGQYESYFIDPEGTAQIRVWDDMDPLDPQDVQAWYEGLGDAQKTMLLQARNEKFAMDSRKAAIHEKLKNSVPELYEGRLPAEAAQKLGDTPYVIGFSQWSTTDIAEATAALQADGGVDVSGYNYDQRFLMFDQSHAGHPALIGAIEQGYYGTPDIGRFVAAFPIVRGAEAIESEGSAVFVANLYPVLPDDFDHVTDSGKHVLSTKYIAGYIDNEGNYWVNNNFAVSDEADMVLREPVETSDNPQTVSDWL